MVLGRTIVRNQRTSGQMAPQPRLTHELQGMDLSQRSFDLEEGDVSLGQSGKHRVHAVDIQRS